MINDLRPTVQFLAQSAPPPQPRAALPSTPDYRFWRPSFSRRFLRMSARPLSPLNAHAKLIYDPYTICLRNRRTSAVIPTLARRLPYGMPTPIRRFSSPLHWETAFGKLESERRPRRTAAAFQSPKPEQKFDSGNTWIYDPVPSIRRESHGTIQTDQSFGWTVQKGGQSSITACSTDGVTIGGPVRAAIPQKQRPAESPKRLRLAWSQR